MPPHEWQRVKNQIPHLMCMQWAPLAWPFCPRHPQEEEELLATSAGASLRTSLLFCEVPCTWKKTPDLFQSSSFQASQRCWRSLLQRGELGVPWAPKLVTWEHQLGLLLQLLQAVLAPSVAACPHPEEWRPILMQSHLRQLEVGVQEEEEEEQVPLPQPSIISTTSSSNGV